MQRSAIYPHFLITKFYLLKVTSQVENLKLLSLSHNFPLLYGTWLAKILTIRADLKQYLCAASGRNNKCKIEHILKCAIRQYSFIKPCGYAEFTQSSLLLISSNFLHRIRSNCTDCSDASNLWYRVRAQIWYLESKGKEKLIFSIFLLIAVITENTAVSRFSSVCCWLCTMQYISYNYKDSLTHWSRQVGNRKGETSRDVFQPLRFK